MTDVRTEPDQVCRKRRQSFYLAVREAEFDNDILAKAVAEGTQALLECFNGVGEFIGPERQ
jgi:hypothetical protein